MIYLSHRSESRPFYVRTVLAAERYFDIGASLLAQNLKLFKIPSRDSKKTPGAFPVGRGGFGRRMNQPFDECHTSERIDNSPLIQSVESKASAL